MQRSPEETIGGRWREVELLFTPGGVPIRYLSLSNRLRKDGANTGML